MRWVAALGLAGALLSASGEPRGVPGAGAPGASVAAPPTAASIRAGAPAPAAPVDTVFRHAAHTAVACTRCHSGGGDHPGILIRTRADCRSCHHALPTAEPCANCHQEDARSRRVFEMVRTFSLPQGAVRTRALAFRHDLHTGVACTSCHGAPPDRSAEQVDCAACHADHHHEAATCTSCHAEAPATVHPRTVHAGCGGAGCHEDAPFAGVPRSRAACLVCHQDHADHRPGQECATCHVMPPTSITGPVGFVSPAVRR